MSTPKAAAEQAPRRRGGDARLRILAVLAGVLAFPALVISLRSPSETVTQTDAEGRQIIVTRTEGPTAGMRAPDFTLETFQGETLRLEDLRDEIVVLYFFASWCPTCETELPQLAALSAVMANYGRVVGVAVRDEASAAEDLIDRVGARELIPAGMDPGGQMSRDYLILGAPGTVVIGPDGSISGDWRGPIDMQFLFGFLRDTYPEQTAGQAI